MKGNAHEACLSVEADESFLPLVTALVEKSTLCFGFGKSEALGLTLAVEEVFVHLCRVVMPGGGVMEIRCSSGGYYMQIVVSFPASLFDARAFNLTATVSMEDDAGLNEMGLLIASRMVDRFHLSLENSAQMRLSLIKEKSYPKLPEDPIVTARPITQFTLRTPKPEEVKFISQLAGVYYERRFLSDLFAYPGKLADMIGVGKCDALAALGPAGEIAGAVLWRWMSKKVVECFGPYVFNQDSHSGVAEGLLDGCIGAIARTGAVGLINARPTIQLPEEHFELLGAIRSHSEDGPSSLLQTWFRLMREDTGGTAWAHPELSGFLEREYKRLVLPREIRVTLNAGENLPRHSVLSAEFDRTQRRVTLRPMWPGEDSDENVIHHVKLLRQEGFLDVLFALDAGVAWQAGFAPGLLKCGFEPCFVLPCAGEGDVIILQLRGEEP